MFRRQRSENSIPLIVEEEYNNGYTKKIRYSIWSPSELTSPRSFPNRPPCLTMEKIEKMNNKFQLMDLERNYDDFLEKNQQLLLLYDIIDDYLEIRDAITIKLCRIRRFEKLKKYKNSLAKDSETKDKEIKIVEYSNSYYQSLLPIELKLKRSQIREGYVAYPNEPKEFKCGCTTIKYFVPKTETMCNKKTLPDIKLYSYCLCHDFLKKEEVNLQLDLEKITKELSAIKRQSNSLDFEDYKNSISKNPKKRRVSRFPWKNV
jgi:hypothetical protein